MSQENGVNSWMKSKQKQECFFRELGYKLAREKPHMLSFYNDSEGNIIEKWSKYSRMNMLKRRFH